VAKTAFESLKVYRLAERLADRIWAIVEQWKPFPRQTVGNQMVRAADSIGANIAEGCGRGSYNNNRRYVRIARGSFNETQHWLRRAFVRKLLTVEHVADLKLLVAELGPRLNAYLKSIGRKSEPTTDNGRLTTDK
jgi:four helix bundle protein